MKSVFLKQRSFINILPPGRSKLSCLNDRRAVSGCRGGLGVVGLLIGLSLPAVSQEQSFAHIDDEILHLTPVTRQLDYVSFLPSMGAFQSMHPSAELFHFNMVLLPAATWTDDDPDNAATRHLATASEIRHSVLPQTNPHGTISLLLIRNGETPMDSEEGQTSFRSNGPALSDAANPESELPLSGSWTALPMALTLSRLIWRSHRRRKREV